MNADKWEGVALLEAGVICLIVCLTCRSWNVMVVTMLAYLAFAAAGICHLMPDDYPKCERSEQGRADASSR